MAALPGSTAQHWSQRLSVATAGAAAGAKALRVCGTGAGLGAGDGSRNRCCSGRPPRPFIRGLLSRIVSKAFTVESSRRLQGPGRTFRPDGCRVRDSPNFVNTKLYEIRIVDTVLGVWYSPAMAMTMLPNLGGVCNIPGMPKKSAPKDRRPVGRPASTEKRKVLHVEIDEKLVDFVAEWASAKKWTLRTAVEEILRDWQGREQAAPKG